MKRKLAACVVATVVLLSGPLAGTAHAAAPGTATPTVANRLCDYFPWMCHR